MNNKQIEDEILKEVLDMKNYKDDKITSLKKTIQLALSKQQAEIIGEIDIINNLHKTLLPDFRTGYNLALQELKSEIEGK